MDHSLRIGTSVYVGSPRRDPRESPRSHHHQGGGNRGNSPPHTPATVAHAAAVASKTSPQIDIALHTAILAFALSLAGLYGAFLVYMSHSRNLPNDTELEVTLDCAEDTHRKTYTV
jgi:hypothetical protein